MAKKKSNPRSGIRRQTEEYYNQTFPVGGRNAVTTDAAVVDTQPLPMDSADLSASPFRLLGGQGEGGGPAPVQTTEDTGEGGAVQQTAGDCRQTGTCGVGGRTTAMNPLYATQELPEYSPPAFDMPVTTAVQPEPEPEPVVVDAQSEPVPQEAVTPEETVPGNVDDMIDPSDVDAEAGQTPLAMEISKMSVDEKLTTLEEEDGNPDTPVIKQEIAQQGVIDTQAMLGQLQAKLDYNVAYLTKLNSLPTTTRNQINQINMVQDDIQRNMTMYMGVLAQQIDFQSAMNLQVQYQNSRLGMAQASSLLAEAQMKTASAMETTAMIPGKVRSQELQNNQLAAATDPETIRRTRAAITNKLVTYAGKANLVKLQEARQELYELNRGVASAQIQPVMQEEAAAGAGAREVSAQGALQGQQQTMQPVGVADTELEIIRKQTDDAVIAATVDAVYAPIESMLKNPNLKNAYDSGDREAAKKLITDALAATADNSVSVMLQSIMSGMTTQERQELTNPATSGQYIGQIQARVEAAIRLKELARAKAIAGTGTVEQIQTSMGKFTGDQNISSLVRESVIKQLQNLHTREPQVNFFGGGLNQVQPPAKEDRSGQPNMQSPRGAGT